MRARSPPPHTHTSILSPRLVKSLDPRTRASPVLSLGRDETTCVSGEGHRPEIGQTDSCSQADFPGTKPRSSSALGLGRCCACAAETPPPSPGKSLMGGGRAGTLCKAQEQGGPPERSSVAARTAESKRLPPGRPGGPWTHSLGPPGPPEPSAGWRRRLLSCPLSRRSRGERGERKGGGGAGCDPAQVEQQGPCCSRQN